MSDFSLPVDTLCTCTHFVTHSPTDILKVHLCMLTRIDALHGTHCYPLLPMQKSIYSKPWCGKQTTACTLKLQNFCVERCLKFVYGLNPTTNPCNHCSRWMGNPDYMRKSKQPCVGLIARVSPQPEQMCQVCVSETKLWIKLFPWLFTFNYHCILMQ